MLSSVALLLETNLCNLFVQMLFFSSWLNAITRGEYLYFIILLKLIEGSWMYKVLESVTLDTQHVISWMHLKTHELSLVLQKDGLGPSLISHKLFFGRILSFKYQKNVSISLLCYPATSATNVG